MCECKDIQIGSYDNQLWIEHEKLPEHMQEYLFERQKYNGICVDTCVADIVKRLWKLGITTTGCCCGHNKRKGYVGVIETDIYKMKDLGFRKCKNAQPGNYYIPW